MFPRGKIKMGVTEVNSEQGLQGVKASSKDARNSARSRTRGLCVQGERIMSGEQQEEQQGYKMGGGQR